MRYSRFVSLLTKTFILFLLLILIIKSWLLTILTGSRRTPSECHQCGRVFLVHLVVEVRRGLKSRQGPILYFAKSSFLFTELHYGSGFFLIYRNKIVTGKIFKMIWTMMMMWMRISLYSLNENQKTMLRKSVRNLYLALFSNLKFFSLCISLLIV